jgi:hypothetical protein
MPGFTSNDMPLPHPPQSDITETWVSQENDITAALARQARDENSCLLSSSRRVAVEYPSAVGRTPYDQQSSVPLSRRKPVIPAVGAVTGAVGKC